MYTGYLVKWSFIESVCARTRRNKGGGQWRGRERRDVVVVGGVRGGRIGGGRERIRVGVWREGGDSSKRIVEVGKIGKKIWHTMYGIFGEGR